MDEDKVIDLRDRSSEDIVDTYNKIANESKIIDEIWNKTGNLDDALEIYKVYKKNKSDDSKTK